MQGGYLFPEIARRKKLLLEREPDAKIISLGIGNTTEPIPGTILQGIIDRANALGTLAGYSGYGDEAGEGDLKKSISKRFYAGTGIKESEIFVSDGAKCDIGRLSLLFGEDAKIAVQDPSYPVYVDSSVMLGQSLGFNSERGQFDGLTYLTCNPENGFFPDLGSAKNVDVIYFCSPNNPTGAVATREQLTELIEFAKAEKIIVVFDAAYAMFIRNPDVPRSIYEIPGAHSVAIEVNSLSKPAGFTGVRLGWTVVPEELVYDCGASVRNDWNRVMTTIFNGASNVVQSGALAALSDDGVDAMTGLIDFYMENAQIIRHGLEGLSLECFGGDNAPYTWVKFPGWKSWDAFEEILSKAHVVTTPGAGFGPAGEGFIRFSAFGHREDVVEAVERMKALASTFSG